MMPPVSLPLNGGTQSARAGANDKRAPEASSAAALMIRIYHSVDFRGTLERIVSQEKQKSPVLSAVIGRCCRAALDLRQPSRHGSPRSNDRVGRRCVTFFHLPERQALAWRLEPRSACSRSVNPPRRPIRLN